MKKPGKPMREEQVLSLAVHQRLNAYALAAGAAGISLLALAEPAAAEIIYTQAHQMIGKGGVIQVDLNNDGVIDLTIRNKYSRFCSTFEGSCHTYETLAAVLSPNNNVVHNAYGAVALKSGMGIGPWNGFKSGSEKMVQARGSFTHPFGTWVNVTDRYIGVKFNIGGETHYGWVRLTVQTNSPLTITTTLTGYAYESTANTPIVAGKTSGAADSAELTHPAPATLGRLALGKN